MSTLRRRVIPSAIVAMSRIDWPARTAAKLRRRGRVELYFAFDDPCSAVAVLDLVDRVRGRDVTLELLPVVERGIPGDPAVEDKRRYAIVDARRLAARSRLALVRNEPLRAADTAFLAEWVAGAPQTAELTRFCADALRRLWFESAGPVDEADFAALWTGDAPPRADAAAVRRNERRMRRRGPYDTPSVWLYGRWYFAHDRLVQIAERLDELGWKAAA